MEQQLLMYLLTRRRNETKMNTIRLKGVLQNIQDSHKINEIEFSKAHLIVPRTDGKEDILNVRFKKYSNPTLYSASPTP